MKYTTTFLMLFAIGCATTPPSESCVPSWLVVQSRCEPELPVARAGGGLPRPLRQEDVSVGVDFVVAARRMAGRVPPPCSPDLPLDAQPGEIDRRYRLIAELNLAIAARPDDPIGYELRARVWDELGWRERAKRDRAVALSLRTPQP